MYFTVGANACVTIPDRQEREWRLHIHPCRKHCRLWVSRGWCYLPTVRLLACLGGYVKNPEETHMATARMRSITWAKHRPWDPGPWGGNATRLPTEHRRKHRASSIAGRIWCLLKNVMTDFFMAKNQEMKPEFRCLFALIANHFSPFPHHWEYSFPIQRFV